MRDQFIILRQIRLKYEAGIVTRLDEISPLLLILKRLVHFFLEFI